MPRMTDADLESHKVPKGNFTYSAAKIGNLGASEFTLVGLITDVSSSVDSYGTEMEGALSEIIKASDSSPRRDNLLVRSLQFSHVVTEHHGFQPLDACKPDDYKGILKIGGSTALYDAARQGILATSDYAEKLAKQRYMVNGIVFVITDGCDNASTCSAADVKAALAQAMKTESLESIITILIGVGINDSYVSATLNNFKTEAGFTQYVELAKADAKTLAKLAEFVSKSISAQSQALGTGGPSQPLTF